MICTGIFFIRRHIQRKKKRAALNEEAMHSDSSCEMPGAKDNDPSPMRSIEPRPVGWGDENDETSRRMDPSEKQLETLQQAADTIVNVKAADLPSSSLGHARELEATSGSAADGATELPEKPKPSYYASSARELDSSSKSGGLPGTATRDPRQQRAELDATTPAAVANHRAELRGSRTPDRGARSELESFAVRYDQRPPQSSHSNYRDVFVDAPERLTPRNSTDGGRRLTELAT
ncbi:hypothetical protein PG994_012525 [Apiospora phragmitis]|uniref:Uncharacterized protein n=1 Tax=Apiospora phragmitis TaxID=2905665 RepID=A0ABR1TY56_9PEZI